MWERDGRYDVTARRSDGVTFPAEISSASLVGVATRLRMLYVRDTSERRRGSSSSPANIGADALAEGVETAVPAEEVGPLYGRFDHEPAAR